MRTVDVMMYRLNESPNDRGAGNRAAFFGRAVHTSSLVPGVGHDHTNMFQSAQGLAALFPPRSD